MGIVSNAPSDAATDGATQGVLLRSTPSPEALPRIALPDSPSVSEAARAAAARVESEALNPTPFTYRENKRVRPQSEQHAFFDKRNVWLAVATVGGQTLDAFTTRYTLDHYRNVKEGSPVARPFENQGWAGTIGFHYGINAGGTLLFQYLAHRRGHHKLERWIPVITFGQSLQGSLMNFRAQSQAIPKR
jgi:hypothetical protein